jgi:ABC-type uncharacterized transport system YnjBCD substrate-binding protein
MRTRLRPLMLAAALACTLITPAVRAQGVTLNVMSGGSQNMVDYITDYLGPLFEKQNPGVNPSWDVDVIVGNQQKTGEMVKDGLLAKYRASIATGRLAVSESARMALGVDVDGYVMPMFESQTALAYNSALVKNPPASYDELRAFVDKNPKSFGYNGLKNGMSGVAFVAGWIYAYGGNAEAMQRGPYDPKAMLGWKSAFADLKAFNQKVVFTPGNAGTLDMLNRGEIAMGPVWVDMFHTWKNDGRLAPTMKLKVLSPGMPGQPYYYAIPAKAKNMDMARKFIELATSPAVQAEGIVKRFNWYPGIDGNALKPVLDAKDWDKVYADVTPAELQKLGKPFPLAPYFKEMREQYEAQVGN